VDLSIFRDFRMNSAIGKKNAKRDNAYASVAFGAIVFSGDQEQKKDPCPRNNLRRLIKLTLPGYFEVFAFQFHVAYIPYIL